MAKRKKNVVAARSSARLNSKSQSENSTIVVEDDSSLSPLEVDDASSNSSLEIQRVYDAICAKQDTTSTSHAHLDATSLSPLMEEEFPPLPSSTRVEKMTHFAGNRSSSNPGNVAAPKPDFGGFHHPSRVENNPKFANVANPSVANSTRVASGPKPQQPAPTSTSNWKELFMGKLKDSLKLEYFEPSIIDGKSVACPPLDVFEEGEIYWQSCLIGQFIEKPPPFFLIKKMVDVHWKCFGKVEIKSTDFGMYIFHFDNQDACNRVLEQLWHVNHRALLLRRWVPGTQLVNLKSDRVPLWVKFRNVPFDLWSSRGLSYIASLVGTPLQMDTATASRLHFGFARICVEVNLEKTLPDTVEVKLRNGELVEVFLEYAWKPKKCTHCDMVGHLIAKCPLIAPTVEKVAPPKSAPTQEWVNVKKKSSSRESLKGVSVSHAKLPSSNSKNNKFEVFNDMPVEAESVADPFNMASSSKIGDNTQAPLKGPLWHSTREVSPCKDDAAPSNLSLDIRKFLQGMSIRQPPDLIDSPPISP